MLVQKKSKYDIIKNWLEKGKQVEIIAIYQSPQDRKEKKYLTLES